MNYLQWVKKNIPCLHFTLAASCPVYGIHPEPNTQEPCISVPLTDSSFAPSDQHQYQSIIKRNRVAKVFPWRVIGPKLSAWCAIGPQFVAWCVIYYFHNAWPVIFLWNFLDDKYHLKQEAETLKINSYDANFLPFFLVPRPLISSDQIIIGYLWYFILFFRGAW